MSAVTDEPTEDSAVNTGPTTAQRIVAVMAAIGNIGKDGHNEQQGYDFRGIEHVAPAVRDAMIAHGLLCTPIQSELLDAYSNPTRSGGLMFTKVVRITYAFRSANDPDDVVLAQVLGEGGDTGDKSVSKALTAAYKYALVQTFCIADGQTDADRTTGEDQTPPPNTWQPCTPDEVEQVRAAIAQLPDEHAQHVMREWWKASRFGSLTEANLDQTQLATFLALAAALSVQPESTDSTPDSTAG